MATVYLGLSTMEAAVSRVAWTDQGDEGRERVQASGLLAYANGKRSSDSTDLDEEAAVSPTAFRISPRDIRFSYLWFVGLDPEHKE